jgi:hypothetical protein
VRELFGDRVEWAAPERDVLEVAAFEHPHDWGEHFKALYGPTIVARANAQRSEREAEFDEALDRFCEEWNLGTPDRARFEQEYLLTVGTRTHGASSAAGGVRVVFRALAVHANGGEPRERGPSSARRSWARP